MRYNIYIKQKNKPDTFYIKAMKEYDKRLGAFCKLTSRFVKKEKEWEKLLASPKNGLVCRVHAGDADVTSEDLASMIGKWESSGVKSVDFFIDGDCQEETDDTFVFCLSSFDMPEAMSSMILMEQIYRGYRILHNQPYHK